MHTSEQFKRTGKALLCAGIAFILGLVCGRVMHTGVEADADSPTFDPSNRGHSDASQVSAVREEKSSVFAARLHEIMAARTSSARERAILSVADGLESGEISEAMAALERFHVPSREEVTQRLLERWGEIDPGRAIAYAMADSKPTIGFRANTNAVAAVLYGWLDSEPSGAESWVAKAPEGAAKERGLQVLAQFLAVNDLPRALRIANQINFDEVDREELAQNLFDRWTMEAPAKAYAYALQLEDQDWRSDALRAVVTRWTQEDPATALDWARSIPGQQLRRRALGDTDDTPLQAGLSEWAQADTLAAMDWVSALPEGKERAVLAATLREEFSYYTEIDPQTAKLLRAMPDTEPEGNAFLQLCASQAATQNPEGAVNWLRSEPDPEVRSDIVCGIMASFTGDELSRVLGEMDPQTLRLDLLASDVLGKGIKDPEAFSNSAIAKTNDPEILKLIATSWLRRDMEKGKAWVEQSALAPGVKEQVLSGYGW